MVLQYENAPYSTEIDDQQRHHNRKKYSFTCILIPVTSVYKIIFVSAKKLGQ